MTLTHAELYPDGSCIRNPGMGGYAYIIRYTEDDPSNPDVPVFKEIEFNQGYRMTTNNRMEIMAALFGIKKIIDLINDKTIKGINRINIYSDSEYVCKAVNQNWINKWKDNNWMTSGYKGSPPTSVKNRDLWEQVVDVQKEARSMGLFLAFDHIKGHNGHPYNERADKLAVEASTGTNHIIDEVFEQMNGIPARKE